MSNTVILEVTKDFAFEAANLVYKRWSDEFDLMKRVKDERDDGSKDWAKFHSLRLVNHAASLKKWDKLRLEAGEVVSKLEILKPPTD